MTVQEARVFGAMRQRDTAAVDLLNDIELLPQIIDRTREKSQFVMWMQDKARYIKTGQSQFSNFVNNYLFATETIIDPSVTVHTADTHITIQVATANGASPFREGESVRIPGANRRTARIVVKTPDAGGDFLQLQSITGLPMELATGQKLASSSIVGASGAGYVQHKKTFPDTRHGVTQIFPLTIAEITDVAKASRLRVKSADGNDSYALIDEMNGLLEYYKLVGSQLLFGETTGLQFNSQTPTHQDEEGRAIQYTQGMDSYIAEEGTTISGVTVGTALFDTLKRQYAKKGISGNFMWIGGSEAAIQITNFQNSLGGTGLVDAGARWMLSPGEINLGIRAYTQNGMTFKFMELSNFDDPNLVNFTGSAGFQNFSYIIPDENVPLIGGGSAAGMRLRYMEYQNGDAPNRSSNGIYMTTRHGVEAPGGPNSEERTYKVNIVSNQGLEMLNADQSTRLILQSTGS